MPMPIWALTSWWNEVRGEEKWHLADERRDQLLPNNTCGMCRLFFRWTQKERGARHNSRAGANMFGIVCVCVCSWWEGGVKGWRLFPEFSFIQLPKQKAHTHTQALKSESGHMCVCPRAPSRACVNKGSTGADPRLLFLRLDLIFIPLTVLLYLYVHLYSPTLILLVKGGTELFHHHSCGFLPLDWKKNSDFLSFTPAEYFLILSEK